MEHNNKPENRDSVEDHCHSPEFDGIVQKLFEFKILRPVTEFPFSLHPVTDHLSMLGHGWYLLTGIRESLNDDVSDETVRACMILWAKNISSALLASRCEDSFNRAELEENQLPPVEDFMPTSTGWTYGEILRAGRGRIMESAVYGSTGEFQFKTVQLNKSRLHYPSRKRNVSEVPIAISLI